MSVCVQEGGEGTSTKSGGCTDLPGEGRGTPPARIGLLSRRGTFWCPLTLVRLIPINIEWDRSILVYNDNYIVPFHCI